MRSRLSLAVVYGAALGASYAAAWLALERAATAPFVLALLMLVLAGTAAGTFAGEAVRRLRRPFPARFAAALLLLLGGTAAATSLLLFLQALARSEIPWDWPASHLVLWTVTMAVGAVYGFLGVVAWLLLPLGLPLTLLFAALFARRPR